MSDKKEYSIEKLSKDSDYYSQRNNVIDPSISCNVTAYINAIITNGIKESDILPADSEYKQPEDYFNSLMELEDVKAYARRIAPNYDGHIRELHEVLVYAANNHLLKNTNMRVEFTTSFTTDQCFDMIVNKKMAFVTSGKFAGFRHIVAVVGAKYDPDTKEIKSFYIDDPYGDYHVGYKIIKGDDIEMSYEDFISMVNNKGRTEKWAHIFTIS